MKRKRVTAVLAEDVLAAGAVKIADSAGMSVKNLQELVQLAAKLKTRAEVNLNKAKLTVKAGGCGKKASGHCTECQTVLCKNVCECGALICEYCARPCSFFGAGCCSPVYREYWTTPPCTADDGGCADCLDCSDCRICQPR